MGFLLSGRGRLAIGALLALGVVVVAVVWSSRAGPAPAVATPTVAPTTAAVAATPPPAAAASPVAPPATIEARIHVPLAVQGATLGPPPPPRPVAIVQPTEAPTPRPTPTPTPRPPMRLTKLGLGVYDSGGAMLPALDESRPSVILLMDPNLDFAQEVRRRFPKAFVVGRIFDKDQPLDNPSGGGAVFADRVAEKAVPLAAPLPGVDGGRPVVDAWMGYNEVANGQDLPKLRAWNDFQVAFARRLQDHYKVPAVAGNDAADSIPPEYYGRYLAEAVRVSQYFGVHIYPPPHFKSLFDPTAHDNTFNHRRIHQELTKAGVRKSGPYMIITELGLWNGWRGVTSDDQMARDFICYAEKTNQDSFVVGTTIYGLFSPGRSEWDTFNAAGSSILRLMGDYNTEGFGDPRC